MSNVPALPQDVWLRISANLDPASLSSLSEVSKAFHRIATDQSHFRRLSISFKKPVHPSLMYRRIQALYRSPNYHVCIYFSGLTEMFCLVQDLLVLLDAGHRAIFAFPSGRSFDLVQLIGNPGSVWQTEDLRNSVVVLPGNLIALLNCHVPTRVAVVDIHNGNVIKHVLPGNGALLNRKILKKNMVAAGDNAEWLMYYSEKNKISLFDWRNGKLVREIAVTSRVKYVLGEIRDSDTMSVIGLASELTNGLVKEVHVLGFDGLSKTFQLRLASYLTLALRSQDKNTIVLITAPSEYDFEVAEFVARREDPEGVKEWHGDLNMRTWPELKENGRVIQARQDPFSQEVMIDKLKGKNILEALWIMLKDDCTFEVAQSYRRKTPSWIVRGPRVGYIVEHPFSNVSDTDCFHIAECRRRRRGWKEVGLYYHPFKDFDTVCVVADHFLLAMGSGELTIFHFDRFCGRAKGLHSCPGFDTDEFIAKLSHLIPDDMPWDFLTDSSSQSSDSDEDMSEINDGG